MTALPPDPQDSEDFPASAAAIRHALDQRRERMDDIDREELADIDAAEAAEQRRLAGEEYVPAKFVRRLIASSRSNGQK